MKHFRFLHSFLRAVLRARASALLFAALFALTPSDATARVVLSLLDIKTANGNKFDDVMKLEDNSAITYAATIEAFKLAEPSGFLMQARYESISLGEDRMNYSMKDKPLQHGQITLSASELVFMGGWGFGIDYYSYQTGINLLAGIKNTSINMEGYLIDNEISKVITQKRFDDISLNAARAGISFLTHFRNGLFINGEAMYNHYLGDEYKNLPYEAKNSGYQTRLGAGFMGDLFFISVEATYDDDLFKKGFNIGGKLGVVFGKW